MNGHLDTWTAAMVKRLTELHAEGLTFTQIADRLNVEFGSTLTRNSCIGKGRRIGLPQRVVLPMLTAEQRKQVAAVERRRKKAERRIPPPPPSYEPPPEPAKPPIGALHIIDLDWADCRWIVHGVGAEALYCGRMVSKSSYCREHYRISYDKPGKV